MSTSFSGNSESTLLHTSPTWTIDNFSHRHTNVISPDFTDEKKNTFFLALYTNGNGNFGLAIGMTAEKLVKIECKLSLINSRGQSCLLFDQAVRLDLFGDKKPGCVRSCIPKLISRADLFEPSNGYLPVDTLTLHCEIVHLVETKTTVRAIPSQSGTMAKIFGTLRNDYGSLLKSGNLADVKLNVGGKTIPAHKLILSARSSVFAAMFAHDMKEKKEGQVVILDVSLKAFETFLEFLYTGAIPSFEGIKSTEELLIAADKYGSEQLKTVCEDFLVSQLTIETAPSLLLLANTVNAYKLKAKAVEFMRGRGSDLFDALQNEPDQLVSLFQCLAMKNQEKEQSK